MPCYSRQARLMAALAPSVREDDHQISNDSRLDCSCAVDNGRRARQPEFCAGTCLRSAVRSFQSHLLPPGSHRVLAFACRQCSGLSFHSYFTTFTSSSLRFHFLSLSLRQSCHLRLIITPTTPVEFLSKLVLGTAAPASTAFGLDV